VLQDVSALFSASFQKSGLNDENLDIFGFQVFSKMQQRAEGRQCTPWDHSTSVLLLLLLLYAYKKAFLVLYNYSQSWVFVGQLYIQVCIECVCGFGHRCSFWQMTSQFKGDSVSPKKRRRSIWAVVKTF